MNPVFLVAAAGFIVLGTGFLILFARLISSDIPAFSEDIEGIFSPERYEEMERLLDVRLFFQPDRPTVLLRRERIRVFRWYIHQLSNDFNHICIALKMIMINSQVDRPDVAGAVMKQQVSFCIHDHGGRVQADPLALRLRRCELRDADGITKPALHPASESGRDWPTRSGLLLIVCW